MKEVKKPIIGIITRPILSNKDVRIESVTEMFRRAVIKNGGIPIGILPTQDIMYYDTKKEDIPSLTDEEKDMFIKQISLCDGLIFQGGVRWYLYDQFLTRYVIDNDIPSLFLCMSMQLLDSVDLADAGITYKETKVEEHHGEDKYKHFVNINKDSILYQILGKDRINVNSYHHYCISKTNNTNIVAISDDNIIEGIEYPNKKFILGLQWHPEKMIDFDEDSNKIIKYFIDKTKDM